MERSDGSPVVKPKKQEKLASTRNSLFDAPPRDMVADLAHELPQSGDYRPRIGILTQPVSDKKKSAFDFDSYILEINYNFIRWGGSIPVPVPYDISDEDLTRLLPQLNGVLFTGGALDLIVKKQQHAYYKTAKKIFHYALYMKDVQQETWPILGICQGLEVVSVILGGDNIETLDDVDIYGKSRPAHWTTRKPEDSQLFRKFPANLTAKMAHEGLALHAHSYSVSMDTFEKTAGLKKFMKVLQTDVLHTSTANITFIDSMEARNYPIMTTMYHPEYQLNNYIGEMKWAAATDKKAAEEIAFRISHNLYRLARQNGNRVVDELSHMIPESVKPYPMIGGVMIYAFGWKK